ncbi:MAG: NDP-sugar synthase [Spirochaetes bacterium]|nr:NDP-sugar synthase [Spirochaetota bacterium]
MKAFLLAAGYGERLRPITDRLPKPLVPVLNVPSICYALALLKEAGIGQVVCNLHHRSQMIEEFFRDHDYFGVSMTFSIESQLLGTGGGLMNCRGHFMDGPFVYMNSDIIADIDLKDVIAAYEASPSGGMLALSRQAGGGARVTVSEGKVVDLRNMLNHQGKPEHDFLGMAVLSPRVFDFLKQGYSDIVETGLIGLAREGLLGCCETAVSWHDIGTIESYRRANVDLIDTAGPLRERVRRATGLAPSAVSPLALIGAGAKIVRSVIGDGGDVGEGALVEDSVVMPGASVAPGGSLFRSVRWP